VLEKSVEDVVALTNIDEVSGRVFRIGADE
jgi:hypothetical protein